MNRSVLYVLVAAVLFGVSTPLAKLLVGNCSPLLLGGLLYLGSGIGLCVIRLIRDRGWRSSGLARQEWRWLLGATLFGGALGPVALMFGLTYSNGSTASLLLNLEAVFTALIAWSVFGESADRRVVAGMVAIVIGSVVLSWPSNNVSTSSWPGSIAIAVACLCWAIDNSLTCKVSASDAVFIAGVKGLIAGAVNCSLAFVLDVNMPGISLLLATLLIGLLGYGISLVMFILALRGLGAARTSAYFSTAPFIGAAVAPSLLGESTSSAFWAACVLMGLGVWLHLTERHGHEHTHEPIEHRHTHMHDQHHQHEHGPAWDAQEPHDHLHRHAAMTHKHPHFPDIHHRHAHTKATMSNLPRSTPLRTLNQST